MQEISNMQNVPFRELLGMEVKEEPAVQKSFATAMGYAYEVCYRIHINGVLDIVIAIYDLSKPSFIPFQQRLVRLNCGKKRQTTKILIIIPDSQHNMENPMTSMRGLGSLSMMILGTVIYLQLELQEEIVSLTQNRIQEVLYAPLGMGRMILNQIMIS